MSQPNSLNHIMWVNFKKLCTFKGSNSFSQYWAR